MQVNATTTVCPLCGLVYEGGEVFCPNDGARLTAQETQTSFSQPPRAYVDPLIGQVLSGRYRILRKIGEGGMGIVYEAEHIVIEKRVGLKVLREDFSSRPDVVERFRQEAKSASKIGHEHIIDISDFGETPQGASFFVMELLQGRDLAEELEKLGTLSARRTVTLMLQCARALEAAHNKGIVHRDMKPENIFLVRNGATVLPKLLDFGVSRSTERGQGHTITREGIVMGTPEYIAPEQARGRMADVRSDIYSLGVVIYEALAGRLPFQADNAADLIVALLNSDPIPLQSLRPELGEPLSKLVHKAMARKPDDRFQTANEMRLAILEYLAATPEAETMVLPRRFIAPTTEPGAAPSGPQTPTESEAPATHARQTSGSRIPGLRSSRITVAALGVGAAAAAIALFAMTLGDDKASSKEPAPTIPIAAATPTPPVVTEPRAAPPSDVVVELYGVPSDGEVLIDGEVITGTSAELPRNSGVHVIEVRAPGKEPWRVTHDAAADGRYALSLEPVRSARESSREGRSRKKSGAAKSKILRTPDF